jgi:Na+/proline symporter
MEYHHFFKQIDWLVVAGYLALTTWVGHALRGKQSTIKDFFLGGRTLPWPAVSGSIIATEISGVTFIGVPGMVYAATGDFTYLQWGMGSIVARVLVGIYFVKAFYEKEIYSPYDFMGNRLGIGAKRLATIIFQIGGILGQSVRVLVAALALKVVTPLEFEHCIWIIGLFAVGWTWMGGMRTVIWTDVMQFFLFVGAGLFSLGWIISSPRWRMDSNGGYGRRGG